MPDVSTQTKGTYCGSKKGIPTDTPSNCFKKGIKIGFVGGIKKGIKQAAKKAHVLTEMQTKELERVKKQKEFAEKGVVVSKVLAKKQIAREIESKGLNALKHDLHLDNLNKDQVRSLATRLTGTTQSIPYYSSMSKEQLIDELVRRGYKR